MEVSLPGRSEHLRDDAIPTAARRAIVSPEVVPPLGETVVLARTDLGARATLYLDAAGCDRCGG